MARPVIIAFGLFLSQLALAVDGPIVIHHETELESGQERSVLDEMLVEGGYARAEWMTPEDFASTIKVLSIGNGTACEDSVEVRVWLERLDRMEMRIQILDIQTALDLGSRLWLDQTCLDGVPARRDLQRLAVNMARAHLLTAQTAEGAIAIEQARKRAQESITGLTRLGEDLLLPAGLEPELHELMLGGEMQAETVLTGGGPDGRLAVDGQRLASGVVRRQPGMHLVQVDDPGQGRVVSSTLVDLGPGRVFLWAGQLEEGAVERELRAALVGSSVEPMLLRGLASGLGRPLFFVSMEDGVATLRRADRSLLIPGASQSAGQVRSHGENMAVGMGPSIGGQFSGGGQRSNARGMAGLSGWIRVAIENSVLLVGTVGMLAREDPLPAQVEQVWATTWEVPVRVGVRFLPGDAIWETGIDALLRWTGTTSVELQGGVCLVLGRRVRLGQNGLHLRTEAHGGVGPGWIGAGLQTGVEVPW